MVVWRPEHQPRGFVSFLVYTPKGIPLMQISPLLFRVSCLEKKKEKTVISAKQTQAASLDHLTQDPHCLQII